MDEKMDEIKKALEDKNWELVSIISTREWLAMQVALAAHMDPNLKELTYFKKTVHYGDTGKYLITLVHVEGEKIQLREKQDE